MRGLASLSLATVVAAAPALHEALHDQSIHSDAAPILSSMNANVVPNSYIIKFKDSVTHSSTADHFGWVENAHVTSINDRIELRSRSQFPFSDTLFEGLRHKYQIGALFSGYSGHFDDDVVEKIRRHPDVEYIERDSIVHTMEMVQPTEENCDGDVERDSSWGLARISHREKLSYSTYNKYLYSANAGEGVDVYVIDTGINIPHVDFENRAKWGKTIPTGDADLDGNGHGTHCAGTIAGKRFGVAKKATVYAVKVLRSNGSGMMSDVISGVDWAAQRHLEQVKAAKSGNRKGFRGSVANMSLGGGKTKTLDQVVNAAVEVGVHFAVAAGNDDADACNYSPAAAQKAVTVGASGLTDSRAYFSNHGKCVDIFAPGLEIQSTWVGSDHATNIISGTSMASPHIAGLLAYYLSLQPSTDSDYATTAVTPAKLKNNLLSLATTGALTDLPNSTPNLLAWNGGGCSNYSSFFDDLPSRNNYQDVSGKLTAALDEVQKVFLDEMETLPTQIENHATTVSGKIEGFFSTISKKFHCSWVKAATGTTA